MKKTIIISIIVYVIVNRGYTQDTIQPAWKQKIQAGFNLNQASFSDNWKGGGVNSLAWNALFDYHLGYEQEKYEWTNDLQSAYGSMRSKAEGVRKNTDKLFFESKYSYKMTEIWRLFASVTFVTQFDAGYDYKTNISGEDSITRISSFLSPGYLNEAAGIEYKPVDWFSAQLGVGALRQTFVRDQSLYTGTTTTLYGVNKGEYYRNQVVFQFVAQMNKELIKNITLKARYMGQADYQKLNGQGIVHRFDANLIANVNRYINTSIGVVVLYDYDQHPDVQYSQLFNFGILYTLQNYDDKK